MKRLIIGLVLAMMLTLVVAVPALADHDHNLITPGTTVVDFANGNTENCSGEPAYHKIHVNVHTGKPGMFGFKQTNNPVSIDKTEVAAC